MVASSDAVDFRAIRRALVIMLRHHGDVLLTSPVFTSLKRALPDAEIDALVYADTAPMLAGHPAISQIHGIERRGGKKGLLAKCLSGKRLLDDLRARRIDLVVHLCSHWRGLWLTLLLHPTYSVAVDRPERLWRRVFPRRYDDARVGQHRVERNLEALRRIGIQPDPEDRRLVLILDQAAEAVVADRLAEHRLRRRGYILIHPGSRWLFKCWPAASTARLIDRLHADNHSVVLTAAPDPAELALIRSIRSHIQTPVIDLTGQTSLSTLAVWIASARLLIGVDSVPMHMAAALQVPVVALFGPSNESVWRPWLSPHRVVVSDRYLCRSCDLAGCNDSGVSDCLLDIDVEKVFDAVTDLLAETDDVSRPSQARE